MGAFVLFVKCTHIELNIKGQGNGLGDTARLRR
jgi:hypothetical protein